MIRLRRAEQRLGDAEALLHAAGERADRLVAHLVEVGQLQQRVRPAPPRSPCRRCPSAPRCDRAAPAPRCPDRRRSPAADSPRAGAARPGLAQARRCRRGDRARVRLLQRRDRAHQRRLPRAVRSEQPEQPAPDREAHPIEGAHAVAVGFRESVMVSKSPPSLSRGPSTEGSTAGFRSGFQAWARHQARRAATSSAKKCQPISLDSLELFAILRPMGGTSTKPNSS